MAMLVSMNAPVNCLRRTLFPVVALAAISAMMPARADAAVVVAYLDPGTGSMALQLLVGGLLGAGIAIKIFWGRIVGLFKRGDKDVEPATPADSPDKDTPEA